MCKQWLVLAAIVVVAAVVVEGSEVRYRLLLSCSYAIGRVEDRVRHSSSAGRSRYILVMGGVGGGDNVMTLNLRTL